MEISTNQVLASSSYHTADPDVAGPGVIIGFMLTGILTFLASYTALYLQRLSLRPRRHGFLRKITPHNVSDPVEYWIRILTTFILQLSDQQLVTGLLLLVCGYARYWTSSVGYGANNLWTVTDIVCYSSFTHAATLLSLRLYFQRHHKLATGRIVIMYIIYLLWLIVAIHILDPEESEDPNKLPSTASRFWHAATIIEAIGILWIYIFTCLSTSLSDEEAEIRGIIGRCSHSPPDLDTIQRWIELHANTTGPVKDVPTRWWKQPSYVITSWLMMPTALWYSREYIATHSVARRWLLCCVAEVFFPWQTASIWLAILWAFSLGALIYSLIQNGLAASWGFGQLLPLFMVLLPFQNLITAITDIGDQIRDSSLT
ncbi:hypothetical protein BDV59DRAFT_134649 [Aspergillus ambiguus]|uniref:uncharacterized protein n=1 Tax=Aspergillus ambiguus TaxID=176160 RepID=UPI003CCCA34C